MSKDIKISFIVDGIVLDWGKFGYITEFKKLSRRLLTKDSEKLLNFKILKGKNQVSWPDLDLVINLEDITKHAFHKYEVYYA